MPFPALASRRITAALAALSITATAWASTTPAHADPIPGIDHNLQIDTRLRLVGINPIDTDRVSREACDILHNDPTGKGKRAAQDRVAETYPGGFATGYALGVMADVRCADTTQLLLDTPAEVSAPAAIAKVIASPEKDNLAMQSWSTKVGVATTTGSLVGAGLGFVVGCALGGLVTGVTVVFVPLGCLTGGVTGAGIGGVVGTLVVGGPTAVIAGIEMVQVLVSPAPAK